MSNFNEDLSHTSLNKYSSAKFGSVSQFLLANRMKALIFAALISSARVRDIFEAYDCQNPENTRFLSHQECKVKAGHETKRKFNLIQKMTLLKLFKEICQDRKELRTLDKLPLTCGRQSPKNSS